MIDLDVRRKGKVRIEHTKCPSCQTVTKDGTPFIVTMSKWSAGGYKFCDASEYLRRINVCKSCPGGHYRHYQCEVCSCIMPLKARLSTVHCDKGYW